MNELKDEFDMMAPDLRCFGDTDRVPIDAERGMRDFSDDIFSLAGATGWDGFVLLGWSMGGGVAMQFAIDHSDMLKGLVLEAPLSPFGFGGTKDITGKRLYPDGLASGAGCVNPGLVKALGEGDAGFIKTVLHGTYVKPGFVFDSSFEEKLTEGIMKTGLGDGFYPGDSEPCSEWPGVKAGKKGVCNTMSGAFCDLSGFADIKNKIPVLWIRGDSDTLVSDTSMGDFGYLGQLGVVPGWPGADVIPPQPMVSQIGYVLDRYKENGGSYTGVVIKDSGHGCHLDHMKEFADALRAWMPGQ